MLGPSSSAESLGFVDNCLGRRQDFDSEEEDDLADLLTDTDDLSQGSEVLDGEPPLVHHDATTSGGLPRAASTTNNTTAAGSRMRVPPCSPSPDRSSGGVGGGHHSSPLRSGGPSHSGGHESTSAQLEGTLSAPSSSSELERVVDIAPSSSCSPPSIARHKSGKKKGRAGKRKKKRGRSKRERSSRSHHCDPKQRAALVNELITSERTHVALMNEFIRDYVVPLRTEKIIPGQSLRNLFSNLELIRTWNEKLLAQFELEVGHEQAFGVIFLEMIPLLRQLYAQYSENYENLAMKTYEKCKGNKEFANFLMEAQAREKSEAENGMIQSKDFLSFLYLPIQRMMAYNSLLTDIIRETPRDHADYSNLETSLKLLRDAELHADLLAKQRPNIDKVVQIQNQLTGEFTNLAQPHRRFVHEDDIQLVSARAAKDRHLFLFNDVILCTRPKKRELYRFDFLEPLGTLRIEYDMEVPRDADFDSRFAFRLVASAKEYLFLTRDKHYWVTMINEAKSKLQDAAASSIPPIMSGESKVFNFEAETSRESLIERIVGWSKMEDEEQVLKDLRKFALKLEKGHT